MAKHNQRVKRMEKRLTHRRAARAYVVIYDADDWQALNDDATPEAAQRALNEKYGLATPTKIYFGGVG